MDILSHGLWGSIIFGRKNRRSFWLGFLFGIAPDFLSFGIFMIARLIESLTSGVWQLQSGKPDLADIPQYVHLLYDITHSFVIFAVVFGIVWFALGRPLWEMLAWPFHVFLDVFTHSTEFFPTPYLWPFAHSPIDGMPWSTPIIFSTNVFFLVVIYAVYWYRKKRGKAVV
jgi:hypothetical protein